MRRVEGKRGLTMENTSLRKASSVALRASTADKMADKTAWQVKFVEGRG